MTGQPADTLALPGDYIALVGHDDPLALAEKDPVRPGHRDVGAHVVSVDTSTVPLPWNDTSTFGPAPSSGSTRVPVTCRLLADLFTKHLANLLVRSPLVNLSL